MWMIVCCSIFFGRDSRDMETLDLVQFSFVDRDGHDFDSDEQSVRACFGSSLAGNYVDCAVSYCSCPSCAAQRGRATNTRQNQPCWLTLR